MTAERKVLTKEEIGDPDALFHLPTASEYPSLCESYRLLINSHEELRRLLGVAINVMDWATTEAWERGDLLNESVCRRLIDALAVIKQALGEG